MIKLSSNELDISLTCLQKLHETSITGVDGKLILRHPAEKLVFIYFRHI